MPISKSQSCQYCQAAGGRSNLVRVGGRRGRSDDGQRVRHLGRLAEDVPGRFDTGRPGAPRQHLAKGFVNPGARFRGVIDPVGPFGDAPQGAKVVRKFVQLAAALSYQV